MRQGRRGVAGVARAGLLGVAFLSGCDSGRMAKAPPEEVLALPSDTLEAAWGNVPVAAPIGPGRWAVVAPDWDAAVIADFNTKEVTPLGGARQKAYLHPSMVFSYGDTIYLNDWGKRRTTVWRGDGGLLDSIPAPDTLWGAQPRARDAAAQLYFEMLPRPNRDGSSNRDSAAIIRAPRTLARFDTVARLSPLDLKPMHRENSTRFERMVFSGTDLWGVWADGTVWIARLLHNQLVTVDPSGKVTNGPELPDPVYEVTQADRDRYLQGFPSDVRPKEADLPFAIIHPPFTAAFMQPGGGIWLEKSKPVLDSVRRIQVLDRQGELQRLLRLTGDARLIAVGTDRMLVAEQFKGGVRLMQIRIPALPPAGPVAVAPAPPRTTGG